MIKRQGNFTIINNEVIRNPNLSAKAKGIYLYLQSRPNNWEFNEYEITKNFTDGIKGIKAGIKELIEHGLLFRYQIREKGKFSRYEWILDPTKDDQNGVCTESTFKDNGKKDNRKKDVRKKDTNNKEYTNKEENKKEKSSTSLEIKNFIDLEHWLIENGQSINTSRVYKYLDQEIKISKQGKLYNASTLKDLRFEDQNRVLKIIVSDLRSGKRKLKDLLKAS